MKNLVFTLFVLALSACSLKDGGFFDSGSSGNSKSGSTATILTYGNYMYALDNNKLRTFDLVDPAHPQQTSQQTISATAETLFAYDNFLYIGTTTGVLMYSLADKSNPRFQNTVFHWPARDPVVVEGNYAYSTTRWGDEFQNPSGRLTVLDVKDKANAFVIGTYDQKFPFGLGVSNGYLYVCNGHFGLNIFRIINGGQQLEFVKNIATDDIYDCIPSEELLVCQTKTGIWVFNIENPGDPVLTHKINN
ncbi:MAG TPA: hypothetical protein PLC76_12705 [Saprospiraceae bacterium]|jgi:hypothetical protein|nr:MAG: lvivd repeat-containing protein [Candidatus Parvibacillus calidus]MBX2937672.1 hypothetical protein [Saprospiraceae bacterium]MBK7740180.1 hypothetical protein [Candidatus Parvibacillus calidus]MBX7180259.1 hypothetical protein [Saprospiraceae bacterium]MCB0590245.1 hypothetical protein [Saprospiraceae bacterium]